MVDGTRERKSSPNLAPVRTLAQRLGIGRREVRGAYRGTRDRVDAGTRVAVIGAGVAGLSAACVLAERGVEVTLFEKDRWLGGRMGAWTEHFPSGESFEMPRSFPAIHRNYYNLRALFRRVDPQLASLKALEHYPVIDEDTEVEPFRALPTTAPLNLIALLRQTPWITLGDLRSIDSSVAKAMLEFDPRRSYRELDAMSASEWLERLRLPARARQLIFRVFARSLFNSADHVSAAEMIARLHFYFLGNPEGMCFDVLEEPASDVLWKPMERYLARHRVRVELGAEVERVDRDRLGAVRVHVGGEKLDCDGAVFALSVPGLKTLFGASPDLQTDAELRAQIESLDVSAPFAVVRSYWNVSAAESRPAFAVAEGLGSLDSIAIYDRFEGESRRLARRFGGSVVQMQAFGLDEGTEPSAIRDELMGSLASRYAEFGRGTPIHIRSMVHRDQPGFAPGSHALRPRVVTPYGNVVLAGDFVKLPFPTALLERAAASGFLAANQLLDRWDVRGEGVWSIPPRGFMASVRFVGLR